MNASIATKEEEDVARGPSVPAVGHGDLAHRNAGSSGHTDRTRYALPALASPIARTMDAAFLNSVANHAAVRPWLGGDGFINLAPTLANPAHVAYQAAGGGFLAVSQGDGRYEAHSLFLPDARGQTVRAVRAALDHCFAATDATELVTKAPQANTAALGLARLAGFSFLFTAVVPWTPGQAIPLDFLSLPIDRWALRSAQALAHGDWLHDVFDAVKRTHASVQPEHSAEEDAHRYMAGAAVLMVRAGNAAKAVTFYNRWAAFTGYPGIHLLREHPAVIDLEGIVAELRDGHLEVLACR